MRIRAGYDIAYECPQPTPMLLVLNIHPSRRVGSADRRRRSTFDPPVEAWNYVDGFGNVCTRITAPAGRTTIVHRLRDLRRRPARRRRDRSRRSTTSSDLPDDVLVFLLGSRYCETDRLGEFAWATFGETPPGWARVQAICDFVHDHIAFDYRTPTRCAPPTAATTTGPGSAATSRIWRSRSAGA